MLGHKESISFTKHADGYAVLDHQEKKFIVNKNEVWWMNEAIRILLVDDQPENLLALEAVLEDHHYDLVKATSGEEALRCLLKHEFAVIVLDVQMPGMDGFETAQWIKSREKTRTVPIIFITAAPEEQDQSFTAYSVGAIDYIVKPFVPRTLKSKIEGFVSMYMAQKKAAAANGAT